MAFSIDRRRFALYAGSLALVPAATGVAHAGGNALDLANSYRAAWNANDPMAAAAFLADDVTYFDAAVGSPIVGRDAARTEVIEGFLHAAPDASWDLRGEAFSDGDLVAFEWTFGGTNTGDWHDGTPATGKAFSFIGATVMRTSGGLITNQSDYYDALGFYKQLGLM
jgi:steroid delta-isomerase-like uncharacterized protein